MQSYIKLSVSGEKQILIFPWDRIGEIGTSEKINSWLANNRTISISRIDMEESEYEKITDFEEENKETALVIYEKPKKVKKKS